MNLQQAFHKVTEHFGDIDSAWRWYRAHNEKLGMSPAEMVNLGREKKLIKFINDELKINGKL